MMMIKDSVSCLAQPVPIIHRIQNNNNSTWASDTLYLYDELKRCIDIVIELTDPHTHSETYWFGNDNNTHTHQPKPDNQNSFCFVYAVWDILLCTIFAFAFNTICHWHCSQHVNDTRVASVPSETFTIYFIFELNGSRNKNNKINRRSVFSSIRNQHQKQNKKRTNDTHTPATDIRVEIYISPLADWRLAVGTSVFWNCFHSKSLWRCALPS